MTRRPTPRMRFWAGLLFSALSGCSMPQKPPESGAAHVAAAEAEDALTRDAQARAGKGAATVPAGPVIMHSGVWLGGHSISHPNGDPLPNAVERSDAIVLNSMGLPLDLREIAAEITAQSRLPVEIDDPLQPDGTAATLPSPQSIVAPAAISSTQGVLPAHRRSGMQVSWAGPLSGLLDGVAAFFDLHWEFRGDQIRFYRFESRTFTLAALPSSSRVRATVNTTGGGAATATGSGPATTAALGSATQVSGSMVQDTANETTVRLWDDIKEAIQAMLPAGSKVAMSPSTGTLTVVAPPAALRRVAGFIDEQNERILRQVTIAVKVLRVDLSDSYDLGLDLGLVFQQVAGRYGLNLSGPAPLPVTAGTPASYVVQALGAPLTSGSGTANATHAIVDALQTVGKVTLVTEASVTTLNGQAAPVSVAEQQSYVASTATTLAGGATGTVQTQITPASLITGFNMQVFPRILDDGEVLLQYGLSLSDLKGLNVFGPSGNQVQLPDVNMRSFLQQALLHSGETLVLAGYQSDSVTQGNTGLPGLGPGLLGGSVQDLRGRSIIVILMTPDIRPRHGVRSSA